MKNIFRNTFARAAGIVLAAASALSLGACTQSDVDEPVAPLSGNEGGVTISVTVPGLATPSTRSMDGQYEAAVKDVDVLVFAVSGTTETYVERVKASAITNTNPSAGVYKSEFRAKVSAQTNGRLVVVANARTEVDALVATLSGGENKLAILNALTFSHSGLWETDGPGDNFRHIPMYGETTVGAISASGSYTLDLRRMLARIDVANSAANFKLKQVMIYAPFTQGYIAPAWNATGQIITPFQKTPNTKSTWQDKSVGNGRVLTAAQLAAQKIEGELYAFESIAPTSSSTETERWQSTHILIFGEYNGKDYWYRVDFTEFIDPSDPAFDPEDIAYMPLLRNYKYAIDITDVRGIGCLTLTEAKKLHTTMSNLKTKLLAYDESKIKNMAYNGQQMLGVGETDYTVSKEIQEIDVDIFSDHLQPIMPGYWWDATIPAHAGSWLTFASGNATEHGLTSSGTLRFRTAANATGANRTATIVVTCARLSQTITVTQSATDSKYNITVTDIDGNDISQLLFDYCVGDPSVPSQKLLVSWTPADLNCTVGETFGTPAFAYAAGSDHPAGTLTGGAKSYTIAPTVATAAEEASVVRKTSKLSFTLSDALGNTETKYVTLSQADKLIPDLGPYLMDGTTHAVTVKANFEWRVTLVSDANSVLSSSFATQTGGVDGYSAHSFNISLINDVGLFTKPSPSYVYVTFDQKVDGVWVPYTDGGSTRRVYAIKCVNTLLGGSNCYMVNGTKPIEIPLSQVGIAMGYNTTARSESQSASGFIGMSHFPISYCTEGKMKACVLWSDTYPAQGPTAVVNAISYDGGWIGSKIVVTPGSAPGGNAIIALYYDTYGDGYLDGADKLIWTWHIWNAGIYPYDASGLPNDTWLDRNLGATTNTPNAVTTYGFYYQWGRKDPFPRGTELTTDQTNGSSTKQPTYLGPNVKVSSSAVAFDTKKLTSPLNIELRNSVIWPTSRFTRGFGGGGHGDWFAAKKADLLHTRWNHSRSNLFTWDTFMIKDISGGVKSVYDPCPPGYAVPSPYDMPVGGSTSTNGITSYTLSAAGWTWDGSGIRHSTLAGGHFLPAAGCQNKEDNSNIIAAGVFGRYHYSDPPGASLYRTTAYNIYFSNASIIPIAYNISRNQGANVRCIAVSEQS